ncbi:putative histone-lysine N-methyltransferase [Lupinus albus]|uniref:Enhancer of polycomb-like protein n=1 Tax=Lupinus albus TaxID=3870 RepID=A0A6A4NAD4_LUPAL|nr:putative histone-lysine N-methyltransferase [Lupinus albus]
MDGREENFNETSITKKSRSLDLKSLYKSQLTKESLKKKSLKRDHSRDRGDDEKTNKRKKVRQEVSSSRLDNADGRIKKNLDGEPGSGRQDLGELKSGLSSSNGTNGVFICLHDNLVHVPTRKRSERKKIEDCEAANREGLPNFETGRGDQVPKLGRDDMRKEIDSSKIKQKKNSDKLKGKRSSNSNSLQRFKGNEDLASYPLVNSSVSSLKNLRRKDRKRKTLDLDRSGVAKEAEPVIDSCKLSDDLQQDEDEENLEENAARMLSSRFDPSCTGFSSSSKSSRLPSANGLSFLPSSSENIVNHGSKSRLDSESASVDTAGRNLMPKKRRHFYDIPLANVDAYWLLKRRIKVFWPLDQSWYYGFVNGYDAEKRLYHIKYDDRDEEWINLQTERFKLLSLRSEIPGNPTRRRSSTKSRSSDQENGSKSRNKRQRKATTVDDSCGGSGMDSEPIISWLARSPHQVKSSSFHGNKKQKGKVTPPSTNTSLLYDEPVGVNRHLAKGSLGDAKNNLSCDPVSQDKSESLREKSPLQRATHTKDGKQHIVYVRKRFRRAAPIPVVIEPSGRRVEIEGPLCFTYKAGVSKIFWEMESSAFRFDLNFPIRLVLNCSFESENLWLLGAGLLHNYGTVVTKWPRVSLEMLFVDNVVGLRFVLFEGCLNMAVAFIFLVLRVFHQPAPQGNSVDLQWPLTSIGFKFSSAQLIKKPLVFAFYSFSKVKNSKWISLDSRLKKHCLLSKQLPLAECTYDNIQAIQNGSFRFPMTSISDPTSAKLLKEQVRQKRSRQGIYIMGGSKVSTQIEHQSMDAIERKFPPFSLSFAAAPALFLSLHLDLLMKQSAARINFCDHAPIDVQEEFGLVEGDCPSINLKNDTMTLSKGAAVDEQCCAELDQVIGSSTCSDQIVSEKYKDIDLSGAVTPISHGSEKRGTLSEWQSHPSRNIDGGVIPSPILTAPRSSWHRNRSNSLLSPGWSVGKSNSFYSEFSVGPRKPRRQVSYSVPFAGYEFSSRYKRHHQKVLYHKRIIRASEKKSPDAARVLEKDFESLSCDANVLITVGDKGWRESRSQVVLELLDHNEWTLAVKNLGITIYSYKANQVLQPGSINRYSHAMTWKGGKDWTLEFPDRRQWALFKVLYEECYNRNIRAASVKNIPIPGVHLKEENDDDGPEVTYVRSFNYFQQVETDFEMALDPSRVLYDMDSDDEQWISNIQNSEKDNCDFNGISEEMFQKTMDLFEKAAYAQKRDEFTPNEIEELMVNVGPLCLGKIIYEHWQKKRQKKGMALIRHFQPPLWKRYQKQVKEWEVALSKNNNPGNGGVNEVATLEKPPMFAFCLKPRGLKLLNKGLKHRSQKRVSLSRHTNSSLYQDGFHTFGRRLSGFAIGDENFKYPGLSYDSLDDSSSRVFSPKDADNMRYYSMSNDGYYRNPVPKFGRGNSNKFAPFMYHNDSQFKASYSQRMSASGKRNGFNRQHLQDGPQRYGSEHLDGSELDEFKLRDASVAAQHARNRAKFMRQRANAMQSIADVAIQRAAVALMTAEAMKTSENSAEGDAEPQEASK